MDVEEAGTTRPRDPEAVARTGWSGEERAGTAAHGLVADRELDLPFEDVEAVGVVVVDVRRHRSELGAAVEFGDLELVSLGLGDERAVRSGDRFALAGA